jgi:hypothetical protein
VTAGATQLGGVAPGAGFCHAPRVRRREATFVVALAALAACRVLLFAAAFPFFSNVDEHRHVDAALKYARGYLPAPGTDAYEPEMATFLGIYGSPEYYMRPWERGEAAPPAWERPSGAMLDKIEGSRTFLESRPNLEAYQPPVHYALAGAWIRVGRVLGLEGGQLLYWTRGLNAISMILLVLGSYLFVRDAAPGDTFLRLGIPMLLVVFPLDVFYYVTQDALSPLLFALGFFGAARLARVPVAGPLAYAAVGAVAAAALLTKYTNLALVPVYATATLYALWARPSARRLRGEGGRWVVTWLLLLLPVCAWLVRNQILFEDFVGTSYKLERMGWGRKSFSEYWDHPLFTPSGFAGFVGDLIPRFWRGQLAWYRTTLAWSPADAFYTFTTLIFLAAAAIGLRRRGRSESARGIESLGFVALITSVATLAGLSLLFVYGEKTDPSLAKPYFSHGRLIAGVLVPFLWLYLRGIQVAGSALPERLRRPAAWAVLGVVAAVCLVSEVALTREIFASRYNWFHLP